MTAYYPTAGPDTSWLNEPQRHLYTPALGTEHGPCWACGRPEDFHHGRVDEVQARLEAWRDHGRERGS